MKTGIELIAAERQEQIEKHNRSVESDVKMNTNYEIRDAVKALISATPANMELPLNWHNATMYHAMGKSYKDRLIIAGALIAAEIDRLNNSKS